MCTCTLPDSVVPTPAGQHIDGWVSAADAAAGGAGGRRAVHLLRRVAARAAAAAAGRGRRRRRRRAPRARRARRQARPGTSFDLNPKMNSIEFTFGFSIKNPKMLASSLDFFSQMTMKCFTLKIPE